MAHQAPRQEATDAVLLALVELAREQAAQLAEQNEELRRRNEELARGSRHAAEFLSTVSHELRTPLTAIVGYGEILEAQVAGPLTARQAEYLAELRRAGENLLALVNDLLDVARLDAGRLEVRRELIDLRVPVTEAAELVRSLALREQQRLDIEAPQAVPCLADARRVRQIALNLLGNAVKFTPRGGSIRVAVEACGGRAQLSVADTGIGIAPEHHAAVFEPFRQVDRGGREHPGSGLGLALVSGFCTAMEGTVELESEPGRGATFRVRLPAPEESGRERVAVCADPAAAVRLHERLAGAGLEIDELGPPEAFVLRPNTRAVVVDLPLEDDRRRALARARELGGPRMPIVLARSGPDDGWADLAAALLPVPAGKGAP